MGNYTQKLVLTKRGHRVKTALLGATFAGFFIGAHYLVAGVLGLAGAA